MLPFLAGLAPFAPIIGGAIGALGALFAPKPKTGLDLGKLRADAEANGFNPLTIIRGGGLGSYGRVTDNRVSNALMTFGSGVANFQYDPYGEAKSLSELALAKAQIQSYSRQGRAPADMSFSTPKAEGTANKMGEPYTFFGMEIERSPWFSPAQVVEDQHGDLAGSGWGFLTIPADAAWNVGKWWGSLPTAAEAGVRGGNMGRRPLNITVRGGAN